MIFAIGQEAMNGNESVLNNLDMLVMRVEDDVHELEILDADLLEASPWYKSCRPDRRNMLEKCAQAMLHRSPRTRGPHLRRIKVTDEATAKHAREIAHTSLQVLLENADSDGALVKFALMVLSNASAWELCYGVGAVRTPPAVVIESRGGHGELKKLLVARVKEATDRGLEPRIVVMTDSDGEWVGDVKEHAIGIRDECKKHNVPCPPLNKRTAENYIPDAVWIASSAGLQGTAIRPTVEALLRLSYQQRDHVRFETPNTDPWDTSKPNVGALFAGVSPVDQDLLMRGNLRAAASRALAFALEKRVPTLGRAEIQTRDRDGDLEALARCIEDGL
jgi:hypothetical protein